jgi:large subunit ribosomal protein L25
VADYQLAIELRTQKGKGAARKLRARGRIPGVFYSGAAVAVPVELDPHSLEDVFSTSAAGMNTLIDLAGGGDLHGKLVLVKDVQRDPVRGTLLHADFYGVDVKKAIQVKVPIRLTGVPVGVALHDGILDHALRELELSCLPQAIPQEVVADVSALDIGNSLHVRDLTLPEGVELESDPDLPVVSVVPPRVEEEAAPAEEVLVEGEAAAAAAGAGAEGAGEGGETESDD